MAITQIRVEDHQRTINAAARYGHNRSSSHLSDQEDVAQEIALALHRAKYDPERGEVVTLAYRIAKGVAVDIYRRELRRRVRTTPLDGQTEPGRFAESQIDAIDEVRRLLKELPAKPRQAIQLYYFVGLTQVQVAQAMGIPLPTVKTVIRRGLSRIREYLARAA